MNSHSTAAAAMQSSAQESPSTHLAFNTGLLALVLLLAAVGRLLVPAHWTSIWMDLEFTGWVVPIGNRLADGMVLYSDGGHTPMPPLSFVLTYLLGGGQGIWLLEVILNFLFQSGIILLLYRCLAKRIGTMLAFCVALAATCEFLMLPKTILYDSMVQFLVAATAVTLLNALDRITAKSVTRLSLLSRDLLLPGALLALAMLTKQSTGVGLAAGCSLAILLGYTKVAFKIRGRMFAALTVNALVIFVAAALLLASVGLINLSGFINDVFLTGSEPKGGSVLLLSYLASYALQTLQQLVPWGICAAALVFFNYWRPAEMRLTIAQSWQALLMLAASIALTTFCLAVYRGEPSALMLARQMQKLFWEMRGSHSSPLLWTGLFILLAGLLPLRRKTPLPPIAYNLRMLTWVLLPAAIFHSMSVPEFRWEYDNNPLVILVISALLLSASQAASQLFTKLPRVAGAMPVAVGFSLCLIMASGMANQLRIASFSKTSWPEVAYLSGAGLRPHADGMRKLVAEVRKLAPDAAIDQVLLLPEDPNVQAWFDRPRPATSNAIIFTDQYWDKYVEQDFALLRNDPPKVIIIGPRDYLTLGFQKTWSGLDYGAPRLIQKISTELLPELYAPAIPMEINFRLGTDVMDVYVRK